MDMEPTYFLYSGKLFHGVAREALSKSRESSSEDSEDGRQVGAATQHDDDADLAREDERTDRLDIDEDGATLRDPFCDPDAHVDPSDANDGGET